MSGPGHPPPDHTRPGDDVDLDEARALAERAAIDAGRLVRSRVSAFAQLWAKGADGDVVTDLDIASEELIVDALRARYPDHRIVAEESGADGHDGRWTWLVDPLDGTNNVAIGLPAVAVGLALCRDHLPVVGVVHEPLSGSTWSAVRDRGAHGPPPRHRPGPTGRTVTLGWTQGYGVPRDDPTARATRLVLEANSRRLVQLWAPLLCWVMLARGDVDGIVGLRPEHIDFPAGALIARESGMAVRALDGGPFDEDMADPGRDRSFVAGPPGRIGWLVAMVKRAMRIEPALSELCSGGDVVDVGPGAS